MNKLKIGIIVAVIGVMVSSVVFAANLVSEVYFSNFKIKLNGAEYSPEMPVLNYLGRTYLALRELGTVTGNEIDFVNNEIIINNGEKETEQPKKVVNKEVIFNNQKHNLQIRYYYDDTVEPSDDIDVKYYPAQAELMFDNKCIISYNCYMYIYGNHEIETYIIKDRMADAQYLVLPLSRSWGDTTLFYVIDNNGQIVGCVSDMAHRRHRSILIKGQYRSGENEMSSKVTQNGIELCYPISQPGEEWPYDGEVDWCKAIHSVENGRIITNILKIYDGDMLESAGAS